MSEIPFTTAIPRRATPPVSDRRPASPAQLRSAYDEIAAKSATADKEGNAAEVGRLKPSKIAAFTAWKDATKQDELKDKERLRRVKP